MNLKKINIIAGDIEGKGTKKEKFYQVQGGDCLQVYIELDNSHSLGITDLKNLPNYLEKEFKNLEIVNQINKENW